MQNRSGGNSGTRFRLFPQAPFLNPDRPPETITIATPPGQIGPGPADDRIYLVHPVGKRQRYGIARGPYGTPYLSLPPWRGAIMRPVRPGPDGHFDHIPVGAPEFEEAHVFGCIRFALSVWERYFGQLIAWHFTRDFDRLEVTIVPWVDNASAGYGFMEVGADQRPDGTRVPFALNFDVIAHELGHLILYAVIGVPDAGVNDAEYLGFHEAAADMMALIGSLHFETMVNDVLEETSGNLYAWNELNRFAEKSVSTQIRMASNSRRMSEFAAGWEDEHDLSEPLTGALFDFFVDVFQENLVERGVIPRAVADLADWVERRPENQPAIQAVYDRAYSDAHAEFHASLVAARDYVGVALAETFMRLSANHFSYARVGDMLLDVDRALTGGRYRAEIRDAFIWREIDRIIPGPRLSKRNACSHAHSSRTITPEIARGLPRSSFRERVERAMG